MEGVNKKLGLLGGNYVDIFKGIPFAAPPKALEDPQRHPGWQGGSRWQGAALALCLGWWVGHVREDSLLHPGDYARCGSTRSVDAHTSESSSGRQVSEAGPP